MELAQALAELNEQYKHDERRSEVTSAFASALYPVLIRMARFHLARSPRFVLWDEADLANEALARIVGIVPELKQFQSVDQLKRYARKIVANIATDAARKEFAKKRGAGKAEDHDVTQLVDTQLSPEGGLMHSEVFSAIQRFLQQLAVEDRRLLELKLFDELTFQEIAQQQGESFSKVYRRIRLLVENLQVELKPYL